MAGTVSLTEAAAAALAAIVAREDGGGRVCAVDRALVWFERQGGDETDREGVLNHPATCES